MIKQTQTSLFVSWLLQDRLHNQCEIKMQNPGYKKEKKSLKVTKHKPFSFFHNLSLDIVFSTYYLILLYLKILILA